ncbi:hypothetical protein [Rhodohalobacter sp. 614A]|uniref:hypothetical protein n=1 Tax=Rhodohalobacter sp. 614A TaxID=2908649 RepID=UPI001F314BBA|nr:hypothetical protein [Rhodohalobacter sp. 614A]
MNIKSKALLAYVVIFLVGGASGFFLNEAITPRLPAESFERGPGTNRDFPSQMEGEMPQRMRNFLIERLDLQDDQIEPFFEIQSEHFQALFSRMTEHKEEEAQILREMYSEFVDDVDEVLTEEQLQELSKFAHPDSIHHRRMQRRERWRNSR